MKKCLASLALGLSLLATTAIAPAQDKTPVPPGGIVVSTPPQSPPGVTSAPSPGFPGVESADILAPDTQLARLRSAAADFKAAGSISELNFNTGEAIEVRVVLAPISV